VEQLIDFSEALKAVKAGEKIARQGWNAQNQFVYHVPAAEYPASTDIAKDTFNTPNNSDPVMVPYTAYLAIKTVQGTVAPWLASQTDMLSEDWFIVR
jgi:hypothetical protein